MGMFYVQSQRAFYSFYFFTCDILILFAVQESRTFCILLVLSKNVKIGHVLCLKSNLNVSSKIYFIYHLCPFASLSVYSYRPRSFTSKTISGILVY